MKDVTVKISPHAHTQYCDRVVLIDHPELILQVQSLLQDDDYEIRRKGFIQIGEVWWIHELYDDELILITCYGKTSMDMPSAIEWAFNKNDRISLKHLP